MDEIEIETAVKLLDEYFYEDDGRHSEQIIKRAYELLKGVIIDDCKRAYRNS